MEENTAGLIFGALVNEFGFTATQSILTFVCRNTGKSKAELLSSYETFSKYIKQVYGDAGEKHILDKLPNMREITQKRSKA